MSNGELKNVPKTRKRNLGREDKEKITGKGRAEELDNTADVSTEQMSPRKKETKTKDKTRTNPVGKKAALE